MTRETQFFLNTYKSFPVTASHRTILFLLKLQHTVFGTDNLFPGIPFQAVADLRGGRCDPSDPPKAVTGRDLTFLYFQQRYSHVEVIIVKTRGSCRINCAFNTGQRRCLWLLCSGEKGVHFVDRMQAALYTESTYISSVIYPTP